MNYLAVFGTSVWMSDRFTRVGRCYYSVLFVSLKNIIDYHRSPFVSSSVVGSVFGNFLVRVNIVKLP